MTLALAATLGIAQGPGGPGKGFDGQRPARMHRMAPGGGLMSPLVARALNLDEAQKTAIRDRMKSAMEEAKPLREQQIALRKSIEEAVKSNADEATLTRLANESGTLIGQMQAVMLRARSTVHNQILTADQRTKLADIQKEYRGKRGNRGKRFGPKAAPAAPPNA